MIQNPDLEFAPKVHHICYLLDHPIFIIIAVVAYLLGNVLNFLPTIMIFISLTSMILLLYQLFRYGKTYGETEVTVYPDRIEIEVGMKEPKIILIEFSNFVKIEQTQTFFQKKFNLYSLVITYTSDFTEKNIEYVLREFSDEDTRYICSVIKQSINRMGVINKIAG